MAMGTVPVAAVTNAVTIAATPAAAGPPAAAATAANIRVIGTNLETVPHQIRAKVEEAR